MHARISVLSREYVKVPVRRVEAGQFVDPTDDTVEFAFVVGEGEPDTWASGSWESAGDVHKARCLVGPEGQIELAPDSYTVWVRITGATESPVKQVVGKLVVH